MIYLFVTILRWSVSLHQHRYWYQIIELLFFRQQYFLTTRLLVFGHKTCLTNPQFITITFIIIAGFQRNYYYSDLAGLPRGYVDEYLPGQRLFWEKAATDVNADSFGKIWAVSPRLWLKTPAFFVKPVIVTIIVTMPSICDAVFSSWFARHAILSFKIQSITYL